jgi:DNA replicative helicase MCM subunit Mcm2 (Cdc46/Mcm family)
LDKADEKADMNLAKHICAVHKTLQAPKSEIETVENAVIKAYVSHTKKFRPTINKELHDFLIQRYLEKRKE